jgi:nucleobase:cation symporter-1, NCS1 family
MEINHSINARDDDYGTHVLAVEPGGAEFIPLGERRGRPRDLFATWMSPNLEFATVFIGVMSVWFFDLTVWQAILAAAVGNLLGSISHGVLSARGPSLGVPQMIISRIPFGFTSNAFPAGLTAIVSGIGWFAVNTVSGSLALGSLTRLDPYIALVIVVVVQILVGFYFRSAPC